MNDGDRWSEREAQEVLPSTSSADQSNAYPVVSHSQGLYSQYAGPVSQSIDNGFHGFQLLVNQAGIYQPVRYDGISSSDGTQPLPIDLHSSVGQGSYVTMVAPPGSLPPHHYSVVVPRTVAAADTHSQLLPLGAGDSTRSYALSQATTSGMSSSSVDNVQLFTSQSDNGSSEAIPLVSHSAGGQDGVISSMNITLGSRLHAVPQYTSNEPDTTQEEDIEQTMSSDPDLTLETSDSGVDSGPSSTVLVAESLPTASTSMNPLQSISRSSNIQTASTSLNPLLTMPGSSNMPEASTSMNQLQPMPGSSREPTATTSMDPLRLAVEADAGISSSQHISVVMETSGGEPLASVSSDPIMEPQEPSTSGRVDDSMENGVQDMKDDDTPASLTLPIFGDSNLSLAKTRAKRKSTRMSSQSAEVSEVVSKPKYSPTVYDSSHIWCDPCQKSYPVECTSHPLQFVSDKVVLSRAWSSLPAQLTVFRVTDGLELGVFAKKSIPEQTQFGPFVADLVDSKDQVTKTDFILQVDREDGVSYIEASDENSCNWMMFVRPAVNFAEQNVVAYQHGSDIFFVSTREIETKQELKVWYSAHYAHFIGQEAYTANEEDLATIIEQESKWSCYECNQQFMTSSQLQAHLTVHDDPLPSSRRPLVNEPDYDEDTEKKQTRRRFGRVGRPRGRPAKKNKDNPEGFQWKKKKTSLFLSSRMKRYPASGKQAFKSIYKKKEHDTDSGQTSSEWMCVHCDLTFDNPSLLNLHTLTHAAEDVGLQEMNKLSYNVKDSAEGAETDTSNMVSLDTQLGCPVCLQSFQTKKDLIEHASEHARLRSSRNSQKPHKCTRCWKSFDAADRLQKHMLCHGTEESKPMQCSICYKRFMNNSALSCHMKIHSDSKYYQCLLCKADFNQAYLLKKHVLVHEVNGQYSCTQCEKTFDDYHTTKKHIRTFHSEKKYPCPECDKVFPRPDKLKLHMLRHSNHREFMCETCGRQFKRKDKLKEHMNRMHTAEKIAAQANRPLRTPTKKFIPKVSPMDFHRFIYKCHACLLGFKRRGMLVNHLAKRHPDTKPDAVPELNLPILRTQKDYYCQYCEKVYKSSSKRKAHILKNHPGADLPASARGKIETDLNQLPNPTFSQTVGSVTTVPHPCVYCHKQYASKAKLLQHQRKKHPDVAPPPQPRHHQERNKLDLATLQVQQQQQVVPDQQIQQITVHQVVQQDNMPGADLLTQAMSELTQSLNVQEYRPVEYQGMRVINVAHTGHPTMIQQGQHSTIELSHLGQGIVQANYHPQQQQQQQQARASPTITNPQNMSPQAIAVTSTHQQIPAVTMAATPGITYMSTRWPGYNNNYR